MRHLCITFQAFDGKEWRLVYTVTLRLLLPYYYAIKLLDKGCVHS